MRSQWYRGRARASIKRGAKVMTEQTKQVMRELGWILAAAILVAIPAAAEDQRLEVVLEKRSTAGWGVAEPGQVLDQGQAV